MKGSKAHIEDTANSGDHPAEAGQDPGYLPPREDCNSVTFIKLQIDLKW